MLHRLQHLPETWQEKLGDVGVTAKKSVSVFIFRNREVCMSMSMKSRMNLSGNWWNWLAGMAVPCRRSGNCSINIRPMWNVRRSKMGNSTGCSGLRRMRKIPIIIVLRMRESISFTIVFAGGLQGVWSLMKTDTGKAADQQGENYGTDNITFSYKPG